MIFSYFVNELYKEANAEKFQLFQFRSNVKAVSKYFMPTIYI